MGMEWSKGNGDDCEVERRRLIMETVDEIREEGEEETVDDENCRFGWGRFRPDFLQRFNTPGWLVVFSTLLLLITSISPISIAITTIERRFHFTSTQIGTMGIPTNIMAILCMLIVSSYSERGNKVRWVLYTGLLGVLGNFLYFITRFIVPRTVNFISFKNTSAVVSSMCMADEHLQNECELGMEVKHGSDVAWWLFVLAGCCGAIGGSTHMSTMLSYLDENVSQAQSMFYNSILISVSSLSLAMSMGLGGYFLSWNEDFDRPNSPMFHIKPGDADWIGAWWVLPLLTSVTSLFCVIPYSGYPKRMPGATGKHNRSTRSSDSSMDSSIVMSIKTVLSTPAFIFATIRQVLDMAIVSGLIMFLPKILESQYGFSTVLSTLIPGGIAIVPSIFGTILGGAVAARLKLQLRGIFAFSLLCTIVSLAFSIPFLLPCPAKKFAGVNTQFELETGPRPGSSLYNPCNEGCNCSTSIFDPYCSSDGITYYSPCFAGCQTLSNCTCLNQTNFNAPKPSLVYGQCSGSCPWRSLLYCIAFIFNCSIASAATYLTLQSNMMCVPFNMRTLALGLQVVMRELFGAMPGPIIFGRIFDRYCLLWKEICSQRASCILYDTFPVAYSIAAFGGALDIGKIIALYLAIRSCSPGTSMMKQLKEYLNSIKRKRRG